MGVPHLNTCCCGCDLKSGSLVIAWLSMIWAVIIFCKQTIVIEQLEVNDQLEALNSVTVYIPFISSSIGMLLSIILMVGVYKRKPGLLQGWILSTTISSTLFFSFLMFMGVGMIFQEPTETSLAIGYFTVVYAILSTLFVTYTILIVYNYKRQLIEPKEDKLQILDYKI